MTQPLWRIRAEKDPLVVVAADHPDHARSIIAALIDHGDLPGTAAAARLEPCPPRQSRSTLTQARRLGLNGGFLAYLPNGMFLTAIGGIS